MKMVLQIIVVSIRSLIKEPVRTFLILQGVIWGTALGVFPPAIIKGTIENAEAQAEQFGTDRLLLSQESVDVTKRFSWLLVENLRSDYPTVRGLVGISPVGFIKGVDSAVLGVDQGGLSGRRLEVERGRYFSSSELENGSPVCVLEAVVAEKLFPESNPIGQDLTLEDETRVRIVGVVGKRKSAADAIDEFGYAKDHVLRELVDKMKQYTGVSNDGESAALANDTSVMVPHRMYPTVEPHWIEFRAEPREVLGVRRRLVDQLAPLGYEPVVFVNAILPIIYGDTLSTFLELNRTIFFLCICVGTSIVCVIMVLAVVERQREIAIRRTEGARKWHIALQFVIETGILCNVGAILGVPLGLLLAFLRTEIEPLHTVSWSVPVPEIVLLVLIVTGIGLLGGLLPALRAVRVDPVEMLRYE